MAMMKNRGKKKMNRGGAKLKKMTRGGASSKNRGKKKNESR